MTTWTLIIIFAKASLTLIKAFLKPIEINKKIIILSIKNIKPTFKIF
jgi:hypothetical protein